MKIGDLVRSNKYPERMGFVIEIFNDLDANDPWIRVGWTTPQHLFEWCKQQGLTILNEDTTKKE